MIFNDCPIPEHLQSFPLRSFHPANKWEKKKEGQNGGRKARAKKRKRILFLPYPKIVIELHEYSNNQLEPELRDQRTENSWIHALNFLHI